MKDIRDFFQNLANAYLMPEVKDLSQFYELPTAICYQDQTFVVTCKEDLHKEVALVRGALRAKHAERIAVEIAVRSHIRDGHLPVMSTFKIYNAREQEVSNFTSTYYLNMTRNDGMRINFSSCPFKLSYLQQTVAA